ncbi:DoxX family protein [Plantactinospora endophytica]|uniref:DoxX family protein n=1 Tax=Plantactinospora endophytica TaxID=673535 RepID=A0ABQ4E7K6_9ACTN|nr:DoxX family protein [Plantactinospora endophytica]GIG90689.1 hypothetical protein Pen02_56250 [Plantactinospora endophytica]
MDIALWIIAAVLATVFLGSGMTKLAQSRQKLAAAGLTWVDDYSEGAIKAIGVLEILAAVGLILPAALDVAPVLVPLAAVGLVVLMGGAIVTHVRRRETQGIVVGGVLFVLALVVVWGRFGPESFTG